MQNPFTLTFGKSPLEPVERPVQTKEIIDTFTAEQINQQMFIITGVRGSGRTVMMTEISQKLRENDFWDRFIPALKRGEHPEKVSYKTVEEKGDVL